MTIAIRRRSLTSRRVLGVLVAGSVLFAACGDDDDPTRTSEQPGAQTEETTDGASSDEEMSDEEMSDEEMSDEEMSDEEMSDEEMSDEEMTDDAMSDEMSDEMSDDEMSDEAMAEMNDVMSLIVGRPDLTVLDDAIHAAGLQDVLHDEGPFTIFAPTDAAFAAYLGQMGMNAEEALADPEALTALLQAHVVAGNDDAEMVMGMAGQSFTTLAGTDLEVTVDGDTVMVGGATVIEYDIVGDNGVIHVIDTVLPPPAA